MAELSPAILTFIVFLASWLGTAAVLFYARRRALLAHPNDRSSHTKPTPYGGGIAVILVLMVAWYFIGKNLSSEPYPINVVIGVMGVIAILSFIDDVRHLPITIRLAVQIFAIAFVLHSTPNSIKFFGGALPPLWDLLAASILWLWFINLFNFMDGIDGIAGVESISLSGGIVVTILIAGLSPAFLWLNLIPFAAMLGFLWWNWQPAKIFLGDVGSIPLGFLFGWSLLILSAEGYWAIAVILPMYYFADATITLLSRAIRGKKIWQAHKEHFYQRAVQRGLSHRHVSTVVFIGNIGLICCAVFTALYQPWLPLLGAVVITGLLLAYLEFQTPTMFGEQP